MGNHKSIRLPFKYLLNSIDLYQLPLECSFMHHASPYGMPTIPHAHWSDLFLRAKAI